MKLVARHGFSDANDRDLYGTPAFGHPDARLTTLGREQAAELGVLLIVRHKIDIERTPVAVSELRRSQETAIGAGFRNLHIRPELNEVKGGLTDIEVREALDTRQPPEACIEAARRLISNPPPERVWVTHAFLIATLCQELGTYTEPSIKFTPRFCELRELPL
jgi:broad specificity phosphatase PhoE